MTSERPQIAASGSLLAAAALAGTLLLSVTQWHSQPYVSANERQMLSDSLRVVIPPGSFDNDMLSDATEIRDPELLGTDTTTRVYRARRAGKPKAVAFRIVAPDGYAGAIELLMGIRADGVVSGVRVISHRETPGLGDAIEARRSPWITAFTGKSLDNPGTGGWRVRRDGGAFDQFTGATITPRAVVGAVHRGLEFFEKHREQLLVMNMAPSEITGVAAGESE